jgi:hypothetical protein
MSIYIYIYICFILFPFLYYNYSFIYLQGVCQLHISRGYVKHKMLRTPALHEHWLSTWPMTLQSMRLIWYTMGPEWLSCLEKMHVG